MLALERLEDRRVLSSINWTNRGLASDRFDSTFGADAAVARSVVDAAIEAWERVITDFNQPGGGNTVNVNIAMESSGTGFGASTVITSHSGGYPTAASIRIDRGNDISFDGIGDGAGYFLDPTPLEHSEFSGSIVHAFTGDAQAGSPAIGKSDLFTLVAHELTHAVGIVALSTLRLHNPISGAVTNTGLVDDSEGGGVGRYFVFDGPSVTHLMSSNNGGSSGNDAGRIVHSAGPDNGAANQPVSFNSAFRGSLQLVGTQDIINPIYEFGRRYLPTDYLAAMFQDAYGYGIILPKTFGTFYALLNESTGALLIRGQTGSAGSDDTFHISRVGGDIRVSVNLGTDSPGAAMSGDSSDIPAYVASFPLLSVSSITVEGGDGSDTLTVDLAGGDPLPVGGLIYDGGTGTDDRLIVVGNGSTTGNYVPDGLVNGRGTVQLGGTSLTFRNLEPVEISNMAAFTFTTPNAADNLSISDAFASTGQAAVRITGTSGGVAFEAPTFFNVSTLTVAADTNEVAAVDTVVLDMDAIPLGITSIEVRTGGGADQITILAAIGPSTQINSGDGSDSITVGDGTLDGLVANLTINDSAGAADSLHYNDAVDGSVIAYALSANGVLLRNSVATLAINGSFEMVRLDAGANVSDITVTPSTTVAFTIDGHAPFTAPGDSLTVDLAGTTGASHSGAADGMVTFTSAHRTIVYASIESLQAVNGTFGSRESLRVTPAFLFEGQNVELDLEFNPGVGSHSVSIIWGDGQIESVSLGAGVSELKGMVHTYVDDEPSGTSQDSKTISVTVIDQNQSTVFSDSMVVTVNNVPPILTSLALNQSVVPSGGQANLQGTFFDPGVLDSVVLDVDIDGNGIFETVGFPVSGGAFSLGLIFNEPPGSHQVAVRLRDDDGGTSNSSVDVTITGPQSFVQGVHLFYNNSGFDNNGSVVDQSDFAAIATDKQPLLFGGTASNVNISGYRRGINGVFVDIFNAPNDGVFIDASDFILTAGNNDYPDTWGDAPAPTAVGVFAGQGANGSDRIYLTFADGAIADTWLRITVKSNADTGLPTTSDFIFGSAPGETGATFVAGVVGVDATDLQLIAQNITPLAEGGTELITEPGDLNKDRNIDAFDLQVVAVNLDFDVMNLISPQIGLPGVAIWDPPEPLPLSSQDQGAVAAKDAALAQFRPQSNASPWHDPDQVKRRAGSRGKSSLAFDAALRRESDGFYEKGPRDKTWFQVIDAVHGATPSLA